MMLHLPVKLDDAHVYLKAVILDVTQLIHYCHGTCGLKELCWADGQSNKHCLQKWTKSVGAASNGSGSVPDSEHIRKD